MRTDRTVVITGAAGGMGSRFVERFLANGDAVIATDNRENALAELAEKYCTDAKLHTAPADITDEAACKRLAEVATDKTGRVDIL